MSDRIYIQGVGFDDLYIGEAVELACGLISRREGGYIVTPNPEIVWLCRKEPALREALEGAALVLADGIGIIYASRILGTPLKQKLPGIDFAAALFKRMAQGGQSVYLLGAKPGVAGCAAEKLMRDYPGLIVCGAQDGYFSDDAPIISDINSKSPDLLLVCLGAPKQEYWMRENSSALDVGLMAGLGGSLDVFAGEVKRAPIGWQRLGLEWLYRLIKEPWRIKRMAKLPLFLFAAIGERVRLGV